MLGRLSALEVLEQRSNNFQQEGPKATWLRLLYMLSPIRWCKGRRWTSVPTPQRDRQQ